MLKILAENLTYDNLRSKSLAFEKFPTVDSKFQQKRYQERKQKKLIKFL